MSDADQASTASRDLVAGEGDIRERTIRFGNVIVAVTNIDVVSLTVRPTAVGAVLSAAVTLGAIFAAAAHVMANDFRVSGGVFVAVVALGAAIAWLRPPHSYLAVGVNGGRTYYVGSKNKEFLIRLGELIRRKIDSDDLTLTAEFSAADNVVAVGGSPPARDA